MNNKPQDREEEIFLKALEIAPGKERAAWLDEACGEHSDLRLDIEELLEAHDKPANLLGVTNVGAWSSEVRNGNGEQPGDRFGKRYELIEEIGRGGMGTVWLAAQSEPVQRKVALKIIKLGMDTREVVARFEVERQALAMMDHPGIAKVFDAGATDQGRLYFVMELVRGVPLTDYCDEAKLNTDARLGLFAQICEAVQHAHQKGVIHRDLKPTNILVTDQDGRPQPKVIDFGVAKANTESLTAKTLFTRHGQMIGTLGYMSPEQAGGGNDVDTRSDVYSLGVLLYELLTGSTPFDVEKIKKAAFDEVCRMVREVDPPKPSTRLSTLGELGTEVAEQRKTDPKKLGRTVRGELDWIAMKALSKNRNGRYQSAANLGGDIGRYLRGEAVEAGPPSQLYRFKKFARRHQNAFWVAAVILLLIAAAGLMSWHLGNIQQEEIAANKADRLYDRLFESAIESLPSVVADIEHLDPLVFAKLEPQLSKTADDSSLPTDERIRAMLALSIDEDDELEIIKSWLLEAPPREMAIVLGMLDQHAVKLRDFAWKEIQLKDQKTERKLRAACILAEFAPADEDWEQINEPVVKWLTNMWPYQAQEWLPLLQPAKQYLTEPLFRIHREGRETFAGEGAALALRFYEEDPGKFAWLIRTADPQQMRIIVKAVLDVPEVGARHLQAELDAEFSLKAEDNSYLSELHERARLAIALFLIGDGSDADWSCLDEEELPTMRTYVITEMGRYGVPLLTLKKKLEDAHSSSYQICSLNLALGNYPLTKLTKSERETEFRERIGTLYSEHGDAGVHSSAEWLLNQWEMTDYRKMLDEKIRTKPVEKNQKWFLGPNEHTMAYIESSSGGFAMATKETTVAQFKRSGISMSHFKFQHSPSKDCPINAVLAHDAMRYCNWLSEQDNISPEEYCYEKHGDVLRLRTNFENLRGFRLPTTMEFEDAGLAGSPETTSFGNDPSMVKHFMWYSANSGGRSHPVGSLMPNHYGLFDTLGNLSEVCHKSRPVAKSQKAMVLAGQWAGTGNLGLRMEYLDIRPPHNHTIQLSSPYTTTTFRVVQTNKKP